MPRTVAPISIQSPRELFRLDYGAETVANASRLI